MLTFAEEVLLLSHDEERQRFREISEPLAGAAFAGAVLMDLASRGRIDTDLDRLILVNATPTGEPVLDGTLADIAAAEEQRSTADWLGQLRGRYAEIESLAMARLVERGILRQDQERVLWIFERKRYAALDGRPRADVQTRILKLLRSDEIPDERDIMIIALADACGLLARLLSETELQRLRPRIDQIIRLDLIGRNVRQVIEEMQAMAMALAAYVGAR